MTGTLVVMRRESLGAVLEHHITRQMTRTEFCDRTGISRSYLSEVIRGVKLPSLPVLIDMSTVLGVQPSALLRTAEEHTEWLTSR